MLNRTQVLNRAMSVLLACVICAVLLGAANVGSVGQNDQIRRFSRAYEFDYLEWELDAFFQKAVQAATKAEKLLNSDQQMRVVNSYLLTVREQNQLETDLRNASASPNASDKLKVPELTQALDRKTGEFEVLSRLAEPVIQNQTELSLASLGFGLGGQVLPPVLYQFSEMPMDCAAWWSSATARSARPVLVN